MASYTLGIMAEASRPGRLDDLDGEGRAPQASSSPSAGGAESDGHAAARRDESRDESRARHGDEADSRGRYRSSLPGLSDDQAQGSTPSRRSSVSSVSSASSCNGSVAGGQPYDYYRAVRDFEGFVEDQAGIKEQFEADLVNIAVSSRSSRAPSGTKGRRHPADLSPSLN